MVSDPVRFSCRTRFVVVFFVIFVLAIETDRLEAQDRNENSGFFFFFLNGGSDDVSLRSHGDLGVRHGNPRKVSQ